MIRDFSRLVDQSFDVLVCGGGIYGAWTVYDAALRGLKVAIVDQGDWAGATSSASSKLIHGGLRYLESFDFKLVKKALHERQMLMKAAPYRVWPLRFGVPVFKDSRLGVIRLKLGLLFYDCLAGVLGTPDAHRYFDRTEFSKQFACLKPLFLTAGFTYLDAQTDDARFVLELIDGALSAGAVCVNYCQVTGFEEQSQQVCGAHIVDKTNGRIGIVNAKQVVDATGRWSSAVQTQANKSRLTKGVHLIMPKILSNEALLLTAKSDGRVFFIIPWYGVTLLGTTDTDYTGDIDQLNVDEQDIDYLLTEANRVLQSVQWTKADIIGKYAGLRVLKGNLSKSPSETSRDWELKIAKNGLLCSIGGKFTSARADAAQIVNVICNNLALHTADKKVECSFPWKPTLNFSQWSELTIAQAKALEIDSESALWLMRRHGKRVSAIFQLVESDSQLAKRIIAGLPFIYADMIFCVQQEMVIHLDDLIRRRMPLLILANLTHKQLASITEKISAQQGWDAERLKVEIDSCSQYLHNCAGAT